MFVIYYSHTYQVCQSAGGASGLGLSMAKQLAKRGVSVTVLDVSDVSAAKDAIREIAADGATVQAKTADTTKPHEVPSHLFSYFLFR
jgi:NAD(P)-dependent dehydrogenase (short-subunit alcohol dehydrogenase family)